MSSKPFDLHEKLTQLQGIGARLRRPMERLAHEIEFATGLAQQTPGKTDEWLALVAAAVEQVTAGLEAGGDLDIPAVVAAAEAALAPIGAEAKTYTVHCCGHAHIDMNWMWSWPETVSVTHDTFVTMDRLMTEYPEFRFSQSQISVYVAMQQYSPEVYERIKARVADGHWEVTASQWVEGDKNLASGEILARHLLYSKRWLKKNLGLPYDTVKIDWEPDTFGHAWTLPGILARGGIRRYYHHRAGTGKRLYWWEGKDGSRVLAYDDYPVGYNCDIAPYLAAQLLAFCGETGLKDMMWIYGVGDHGGGPTRNMLSAARDMNAWPIWPNVKLSTTDAFYSIAERQGANLPVVKDELNFVFRGCYTAESQVKYANRLGENSLVDAEACAVIGGALAGLPYPTEALTESWERAMFIQFHDILPGSGVRETRQHCMGLLQETLANTQSIRTRALRAVASKIDTAKAAGSQLGAGLGFGVGRGSYWGGLSTTGSGAGPRQPFVVFNTLPYVRSDVVNATLWDFDARDGFLVATDDQGAKVRVQVLHKGQHWAHHFAEVAFPVKDLPALGYRTYVLEHEPEPVAATGVTVSSAATVAYSSDIMGGATLENEFLKVAVAPGSGAIVSLVDKRTGKELVPEGKLLGALIHQLESPHPMTSWETGQVAEETELSQGATIRVVAHGPHAGAIETMRVFRGCRLRLTIALKAGSSAVEFSLDYDWRDFGDPGKGVPVLKVAFPVAVEDGKATFEIPCGYIERPTTGDEVPALRWADLSGPSAGAALLNRSKYGHQVAPNEIRLTILRASYDPDPLPEVGAQTVEFALVVHDGLGPAAITREAQGYNHPMLVVGTDNHAGELPLSCELLKVLTPNVALSGIKKAEDSGQLIVRLYEIEGRETEARVRVRSCLAPADAPVAEVDLLEQPLASSTARREGDEVVVTIPPFGIATVAVG